MKAIRWAAAGLSVLVPLVLGQGAVLAQPPGAVAAGEYHTVAKQAGFSFFDPTSFASLDLTVTDTAATSALQGSAPSTTETTQLQIDFFDNGTGFNGCYDIASADFTFGSTSASLHTAITTANVSCNSFGGLPLPVTIDATWTGNGPVFQSGNGSQFFCGGYGLETTVSTVNQGATGTAGISPLLAGSFSGQGNLRSDDTRQHAEGVEPDNCQPFGAIAGGAGPPPAGDYTSTLVTADFFIQNPGDFQPSLEVSVFENVQQSNPKVGSPSSTAQFQVSINSTAGGNFEFGCFSLDPSEFSNNGVQGATLNTTFTADSPQCFPGGQVTLPLPLAVNIVWTGSGPIATTHTLGDLTCLTYRNQGSGMTQTNNENVTASISPLLAAPVTAVGTMQTSTSNDHAEGTQQPDCHL